MRAKRCGRWTLAVGLYLLVCAIGVRATEPAPLPDSERGVLLAFYEATSSGNGWINKSGWGSSSNACTWHGIVCVVTGTQNHVTEINLGGNRLVSTPNGDGTTQPLPSLADLPYLVALRLIDNGITGGIPALPISLQVLYLNSNQMKGTLGAPSAGLMAGFVALCNNQFWAGNVAIDALWSTLTTPNANWLGCQARLSPGITFPSRTIFELNETGASVAVTTASAAQVTYFSSVVSRATVDGAGGLALLAYGGSAITASQPAHQNYAAQTKTEAILVAAPCDRDQGRVSTTDPGNCILTDDKNRGPQGCNADGNCSQGGQLVAPGGYLTLNQTLVSGGEALRTPVALTFNSNSRDLRHSFELRVILQNALTAPKATVKRADGKGYTFTKSGGAWVAEPDSSLTLTSVAGGYEVHDLKTDTKEQYDSRGRLTQVTPRSGPVQTSTWTDLTQTVTDTWGRTTVFEYVRSPLGYVYPSKITDPAGKATSFSYNFNNALMPLIGMTTPDGWEHTYATTGTASAYTVTEGYRSAGSSGAATPVRTLNLTGTRLTSMALPFTQSPYVITYNGTTSVVVKDAYNTTRTYGVATVRGAKKELSIAQPSATGTGTVTAARAYDSNGNRTLESDFRGNSTTWTYDLARNLPLTKTEAANVPALTRTINYAWHSTLALPTQIVEPGRSTVFVYDAVGNLTSRTITAGSATRVWQYTYNSAGQVLTVDGPRTDVADVTTYAYDPSNGNLLTVTNPLGQVTAFSNYDANGRAGTVTGVDEIVTQRTYDAMGRILTQQIAGATTAYTYNALGRVSAVTMPDGSVLYLTYDTAHQLTKIEDDPGNSITYTLDVMGNRTGEVRTSAVGDTTYAHSRVFNGLNRVVQDIGAAQQVTNLAYDEDANLITVTDPLNHATAHAFDALNRRVQTTDALNGVTGYGYDARDNVVAVTDAKGQRTSYTVNGLDQVASEASQNTGTTTLTYDDAGNGATRTDARGIVATTSYDALNRPITIAYPDQTIAFIYDDCSQRYGVGKLCSVSDASGSTSYTYDSAGRVSSKTQTVINGPTLTTLYGWNPAGQLLSLTTPAGNVVGYEYTDGRPTSIKVNHVTLLSGVQYEPFGPNGGWQWGNSDDSFRIFDNDYRLTQWQGPVTKSVAWDAANRITAITATETPPTTQTYGYDAVNRLLTAAVPAGTFAWTFDPVGNRLTQVESGATTSYSYVPGSQKLGSTSGAQVASFAYTPDGSTEAVAGFGAATFTYDGVGRMASATANGITTAYQVNALGLRVRKASTNGTTTSATAYAYDETGRLVGEYDGTTTAVVPTQETVWLGDLPVATIRGGTVYYVHADHLGTPRYVTEPSGALRWMWESDPYGVAVPNETPTAGLAAFQYNLRFPGQVYDAETGLHQNGFRDYDPVTGKYAESDPIGLGGGVNSFGYVGARPTSLIDRLGLWSTRGHNYFIEEMNKRYWHLPSLLVNAIKTGSAEADSSYYQDAAHSYMHAMSSDKLAVAQATAKYCDYVAYSMLTFQQMLLGARSPLARKAAYAQLGMALHAVMDSTSPSHRGFQSWNWTRETISRHGDNSMEDEAAAQKYRDETLAAMIIAMQSGFAPTCGCPIQ